MNSKQMKKLEETKESSLTDTINTNTWLLTELKIIEIE
jgi:hypothetical protein